ncbi:hypothetical protein [Aromatoleum petrolei]|uniref:Uncharacterized protein n=1 Tax=Aromatoleum petrolei TaxID=76116 RepID=A0ABX1MJI1_9RHOO|nr:hypothetical protein [Aromatoleum petrolei]NMF88114.1 hypothetical protein [Aromatoleum petrolei]
MGVGTHLDEEIVAEQSIFGRDQPKFNWNAKLIERGDLTPQLAAHCVAQGWPAVWMLIRQYVVLMADMSVDNQANPLQPLFVQQVKGRY